MYQIFLILYGPSEKEDIYLNLYIKNIIIINTHLYVLYFLCINNNKHDKYINNNYDNKYVKNHHNTKNDKKIPFIDRYHDTFINNINNDILINNINKNVHLNSLIYPLHRIKI